MSKIYTKEQLEWVKLNYPLYSRKEITMLFNKKFNMNITEQKIKSLCRTHNIKCGRTGRFEKGITPFNKGRPMNEWMSKEGIENSSKTRFKSSDPSFNNRNHKEVPYGTESTTIDEYIKVKVPYYSNSKANPHWKSKHTLVWEQHNGPVPKGYIVIFLDGNKKNCDISNLQCIPRSIHGPMCLNNFYKHSKEITQAGIELFQSEKLIKEMINNESRN